MSRRWSRLLAPMEQLSAQGAVQVAVEAAATVHPMRPATAALHRTVSSPARTIRKPNSNALHCPAGYVPGSISPPDEEGDDQMSIASVAAQQNSALAATNAATASS